MLPLWETGRPRRQPMMTRLLIAISAGVFVWQLLLLSQGERTLEAWLLRHALVPARLLGHLHDWREWATVFSSMFMHGGVAHLLGNCWFLWVFGASVEARMGSLKFLLFYLLTGAAAAGAQILSDPASGVPMVGASGAISGVLGAYFVLLPREWIVALVPWVVPIVPLPAVVFLVVWFAMQTLNGVGALTGENAGAGVAWWAHAGGFAAGVVAAWFARKRRWVRRGR